jgi:hypothetical protein
MPELLWRSLVAVCYFGTSGNYMALAEALETGSRECVPRIP